MGLGATLFLGLVRSLLDCRRRLGSPIESKVWDSVSSLLMAVAGEKFAVSWDVVCVVSVKLLAILCQ